MTNELASVLISFIWQGTLIAFVYASARRFVRRVESRYLLSCSALLLMAAAPLVTFFLAGPSEPVRSARGVVGVVASASVTADPIWFAPTVSGGRDTTTWIVMIWLIGVFAFSARLTGGWIVALRTRSRLVRPDHSEWQEVLERLRTRLCLARPVRLVVSALVQVPMVVGWLRPVVLVPLGALTGLEPALVEALLAHELAHIRRQDYLVSILQGVVEALLFYHPAVWWVSSQVRTERELCCDDIAVSVCGDTITYVRALAELESCRPAHWNPALAANGASLSERIGRPLGLPRPSQGVGSPAVAAIGFVILAGVLIATRINAQQAVVASSSLPAFEVASIKPSDPDSQLKVDFAAGGRLVITHATLRFMIKIAYDVTDDQIIGGPSWLSSKRFDIQGKPDSAVPGDPQTMTKDQILLFHQPTRLRLQRLLADRFGLELSRESKSMPIFALVPGKNGPKLKKSSTTGEPEFTFGHGILQAKRFDMAALAKFLSEGQVGRPVEDTTGLTGKFDFRLEWNPDASLGLPTGGNQPADNGGVSVFTALQQQLGLRLDPRTSPADTLVVTRVTLPASD